MMGPWNENFPASPHKLLDAYVRQLADFTPLDADATLLGQEADIRPRNIGGFSCEIIEQGTTHIFCMQKTAANRY
jgi:hypothetical protein